jgi:glycerophosphoryl diester phosphodiesterase
VRAKQKTLPRIARTVIQEGYLFTFDSDGRMCLDCTNRERVVLLHDLRVYGPDLHIGALGWTIPTTTDGYSVVDVEFDTGQRLRVKRYAFERITAETQEATVSKLLSNYQNTRFDADSKVAERCREEWIAKVYSPILLLNKTVRSGVGDQEVYAFTFPSLKELAQLRGDAYYPVKIGYTRDSWEGAYGRIKSQIFEKAAYPEKPEVLCIWRTWDGRHLETQVHRKLRALNRKIPTSLGAEWFLSSIEELVEVIAKCNFAELPPDRVVVGAGETIAEGFAELMAEGATIEMANKGGAISIGIRNPANDERA